jgi:hypothetical protein
MITVAGRSHQTSDCPRVADVRADDVLSMSRCRRTARGSSVVRCPTTKPPERPAGEKEAAVAVGERAYEFRCNTLRRSVSLPRNRTGHRPMPPRTRIAKRGGAHVHRELSGTTRPQSESRRQDRLGSAQSGDQRAAATPPSQREWPVRQRIDRGHRSHPTTGARSGHWARRD